eukprot:GHVL01042217.1.p1 GENE.GHVL01042217.1~~GHVL01042217.1.p1  ORF type:complete len:151 (-),score=5.69 GHVL01042217.1:387-839(-)
MPGGKCFFNPRWLEEKEYKDWIQRDCDKYKAFCKCCKARVDISVMGESALVSHAKGKKHTNNLKASAPVVPIANFLSVTSSQSSQSASITATPGPAMPTSSRTLSSFCTKTDVLKSEVMWTMNAVNSHYSFKPSQMPFAGGQKRREPVSF